MAICWLGCSLDKWKTKVCELFKPLRCIKASFYIPKNRLNLPTTRGFRMKIFMKLVHQYMTIFFNFLPTSSHLHPLQNKNCGSNSRIVVDEDDNGNFRLERVNNRKICFVCYDNVLSVESRIIVFLYCSPDWLACYICMPDKHDVSPTLVWHRASIG